MFREMHHMDRGLRAMDLAEKMAKRRRRSLAAALKLPSRDERRRGMASKETAERLWRSHSERRRSKG